VEPFSPRAGSSKPALKRRGQSGTVSVLVLVEVKVLVLELEADTVVEVEVRLVEVELEVLMASSRHSWTWSIMGEDPLNSNRMWMLLLAMLAPLRTRTVVLTSTKSPLLGSSASSTVRGSAMNCPEASASPKATLPRSGAALSNRERANKARSV
jgi:hypothetical protein